MTYLSKNDDVIITFLKARNIKLKLPSQIDHFAFVIVRIK